MRLTRRPFGGLLPVPLPVVVVALGMLVATGVRAQGLAGRQVLFLNSYNYGLIDHEQAVRWGIPLTQLPPDAIVVNTVESFHESNRTLVWSVAGFMALQTAVIAALVVNIVRRRATEREMAAELARRCR